MTEVTSDMPSHFSSKNNTGACIDRTAWSIPHWAFNSTRIKSGAVLTAEMLDSRGLSDHAICYSSISIAKPVAKDNQPIPPFITKHKYFVKHIENISKTVKFESLTPVDRLLEHKKVIKPAAKMTRDEILLEQCSKSVNSEHMEELFENTKIPSDDKAWALNQT